MTLSKQDNGLTGTGGAPGENGGARILLVAGVALGAELRPLIEGAGFPLRVSSEPHHAADVAASWQPSVALIDAALVGPGPAELVQRVRSRHPCLFVLLSSAAPGEAAAQALRCGVDAVLPLPLEEMALRRLIGRESATLRNPVAPAPALPGFVVGTSPQMREVWRLVMLAAQGEASVLIDGETGVGKEVVARALHRFSPRRQGPFVAVNCAALPESLLESELFGHEKGSFTGAAARHRGRFELADKGTLFLDEIGDVPPSLQVKLLRVLQERSFERVGGSEPISVDVRVIAATHRNLAAEAQRGDFRSDLFYRLNVLALHMPPLRERKGDITGLWKHFLDEGARRDARPSPETGLAVRRTLLRHDWPGNVRELQNAALHALTVCGPTVTPADLPESLTDPTRERLIAPSLVGMTLHEVERELILQTYDAVGTVQAAADMLGMSTRKIHYRLREYRDQGLAPVKRARRRRSQRLVSPIPAGPPQRVLLAEDDDELRWALEDFLKAEGYDVTAVPDGRSLLEQMTASVQREPQNGLPDIIITDLRMPGVTGLQLLEGVRERGWQVPVVLISAFGDRDTRERAQGLGAAAFMDKPIDVTHLHRVINEALAS